MTRDEQLIKAALDMAATHARAAFDARSTSRKGHHSLLDWTDGYDEATRACAAAIRAIDVDEVLAGMRPRCDECDEGILPCPFCGGPAVITEIDDGENAGGSCVCCTKCLASGNVEFGFKENFVSNWNRRVKTPVPDAVARLVEAARAALNYIENTEGEFGITLESATDIRTALAAMETRHD